MKSGSQRDKRFTVLHLCWMCTHRVAVLLGFLLGVVLADVGCVRNVRTANDNFYVINRKTSSIKPTADPNPVLAHANPELSDPATEVLKTQANGGLRAKNLLSNVAILEEENSRISSLLKKAQSDPSNAPVQYELGRA